MPRADHDSLFKQTFGNPPHAAAELRALLHAAIAARRLAASAGCVSCSTISPPPETAS